MVSKGKKIEGGRDLIIYPQLGIQPLWHDFNWALSYSVFKYSFSHFIAPSVCIFIVVIPLGGNAIITVLVCDYCVIIVHIICIIL